MPVSRNTWLARGASASRCSLLQFSKKTHAVALDDRGELLFRLDGRVREARFGHVFSTRNRLLSQPSFRPDRTRIDADTKRSGSDTALEVPACP